MEDLLHERGIDVSHETVRFWWNRFGPMFASEIARKRRNQARSHSNWQWHLDEVFVQINGERQETGLWVNNRAENSHLPFRQRERVMLRFRRAKTLQKFVSIHALIQNHFNQERHLYSRINFKLNRAAALAEWRQLLGA